MTVTSIEHVLVLTDDIDATRDFYCPEDRVRCSSRTRTASE